MRKSTLRIISTRIIHFNLVDKHYVALLARDSEYKFTHSYKPVNQYKNYALDMRIYFEKNKIFFRLKWFSFFLI